MAYVHGLKFIEIILIIEIHNIVLDKIFSDYNLGEKDFFAFYINLIFVNIGFIGILAIYLSYFCFKTNKKIFYVLISWILTSLILASILIFKIYFIDYPFTIPQDISRIDYHMMIYWFSRVWYYSIPAFSLISSIGLIFLMKKRKKIHLIKKRILRKIFDLSSISILISLSFSSFILGGMYWACTYKSGYLGYSDSEAQMIGWISENIPHGSNISIDNSHLSKGLQIMAGCNTYYINEQIEAALEKAGVIDWGISYGIDHNCSINMIEELGGHENVLKIEDQNNNGSAHIYIKFNSAQNFGSIEFFIRTTNKSKTFWIDLRFDSLIVISFNVKKDKFTYYDGYKYQDICNIENDNWYKIRLDFECSNSRYKNLTQNTFHCYVNDIKYSYLKFWNNHSNINRMTFQSQISSSGWIIYFDSFNYSWDSNFNLENGIFKGPIIYNFLKNKEIRYLVISDDDTWYKKKAEKYINIQKDLISSFYSELLFQYKGLTIYHDPS